MSLCKVLYSLRRCVHQSQITVITGRRRLFAQESVIRPIQKSENLPAHATESQLDSILSMNKKINLLYKEGNFSEALRLSTEVRLICKRVYGFEHRSFASAANNEALMLKLQGRIDEAVRWYQISLFSYECCEDIGPDHPSLASAVNNLALAYKSNGRNVDAFKLFLQALTIREKHNPESPEVATTLHNLASMMRDDHSLAPLLDSSEPVASSAVDPNQIFDRVVTLQKRALSILKKRFGDEHSATATAMNNLAMSLKMRGSYEEARSLYLQALGIRSRCLPPGHPDHLASLYNLSQLHHVMGNEEESVRLQQQILQIGSAAGHSSQ